MKIGDKVKITRVISPYGLLAKYLGQIGEIIDDTEKRCVKVRLDNGKEFYCFEEELELIKLA
jgi:hypothetical protein